MKTLNRWIAGWGLLLWAVSIPSLGQIVVKNIRLSVVNDSSLEILYDIEGNQPTDSVYVRIRSQTNGLLNPSAQYLSGDLGLNVRTGPGRRIVWRVLENGYELDEPVRATILVKVIRPRPMDTPTPPTPTRTRDTLSRRPGGPEFALLSVLAPGVGNIFVQTPRPRIGYRLAITSVCYGLMAYGLTERKKSRDEYKLYEQQRSRPAAQPYYDRANALHHRYYIATRLAGAIWITDIVSTFIRGARNQQEWNRRNRTGPARPKVSVRPGAQAGTPVAVVKYTF
ncbi:hypothetical protein [Larkinella soli]|uniref:hypothetical protein n=1 Tax=Larkinella soli TaxID=1770527 RepID=UPI000FFB84AD|nr:hypothetical protein [Larkinella soli]